MTTLALLGTGLLGSAMAERFARQGARVTVWNRTRAKAAALEPFGITVAETPAEAVAGAEFVHLVLRDDASVNEVIAACGDALQHTVVVDHTTVLPSGVAERAARLAAGGVSCLHAPVFMGPAAARKAGGSMFVSGPTAVWEAARAHLETMAGKVVHLGERPDLAAVWKLVGNALIITVSAGLADALAVAQAAGVAPLDVMPLFDTVNPAGTLGVRGKAMAAGDYRASFELAMARKDVQLMLDAAAEGGETLHMLPAIAARMDTLLDAGHASRDFAVLAVDTIPLTAG